METWVLLAFIYVNAWTKYYAITLDSAEFHSQVTCQAAEKVIKEKFAGSAYSAVTACVKK